MWFHHTPIYGIHTAAYHGVAVTLGNYCFNTFKRSHTQCTVYVLCMHVCMYVHMKLHMHMCAWMINADHTFLDLHVNSHPLCRMRFGWCVSSIISCTGVDQEMKTAISDLGQEECNKYSFLSSSSHRCSLCNRWVAIYIQPQQSTACRFTFCSYSSPSFYNMDILCKVSTGTNNLTPRPLTVAVLTIIVLPKQLWLEDYMLTKRLRCPW